MGRVNRAGPKHGTVGLASHGTKAWAMPRSTIRHDRPTRNDANSTGPCQARHEPGYGEGEQERREAEASGVAGRRLGVGTTGRGHGRA